MAVEIAALVREFHFKGEVLPDPDPNMTPVEVIELYSGKYPELAAAVIKEPRDEEGVFIYDVEYSVGNKA